MVLIAVTMASLNLFTEEIFAKKVTCSSFEWQQQAQELFETDKFKYRALDKDRDEIACEDLPSNPYLYR